MSDTSDESVARGEARWFVLRLIGLFVFLVAGFLLVLSMKGQPSSQFPRVKLSDGTWIVARKVSVGTKHLIEIPLPFDQQFRQWRRGYQESHTSQADRMVIWLSRENDRGEMLDFDCFHHCELVLSDDFRVSPNHYHKHEQTTNSSSGSGVGSSGYDNAKPVGGRSKTMQVALVRFELPLVRPREGQMRLAIYDGTKQVVAQLELPYPALPNPPADDWQPDQLPATKTDGNLDVTLKGMKYRKYQGNAGVSVDPQLEFVHDGQPSGTWHASTEIFDPLGNTSSAWNCDLSPLEAVWKLRLTLAQDSRGRFLAEETKRLKLRPLAPDKKLVLLSETHRVNENSVQLIGLGGCGPIEFTLPNLNSQFKTGAYQEGRMSSGMSSSCSGNRCNVEFYSGSPFLITTSTAEARANDVQFVIRDQSGEILPHNGSGTEGMMFWFFQPKPTSTDIDVEIIAQQPRHVEFLIAPPQPDQIQTK